MMMDFAPYGVGGAGGGGGGLSSSSNLSALAPPFTVDRSGSKPLVDLTEPPLNWLNTHPLSFESVPSSNAYGYSLSSSSPHLPATNNSNTSPVGSTEAAVTFFYGSQTTPDSSFIEAKPYYPSYISSTKFTYDDYIQSLSSSWDGLRGGEYDRKVEIGDSFYSKEMNVADASAYRDYNPVVHSSQGLNACEEKSNRIDIMGSEKHPGTSNREPLDYNSFPGQTPEFIPVEYSRKPVLESPSVFPDTYSIASSADQVRYRNHHTPYGAPYENFGKQQATSPNDTASVMKSPPGLVIRTVGSGAEAPKTSPFHNVEIGSGGDNIQFACTNNFPNRKDFHPLQSSEGKLQFDSSLVSYHLEGDNRSFPESSSEKNVKLLGDVKASEDLFREKYGFQVPQVSHSFNLPLDSKEAVSHFEECSESFDHYNPAVDSPCWKGAPVSHYSPPFETSGAVTPQLRKKIEPCNGSTHMGPLIFPVNADVSVKFCSQKPSEYPMYQESGSLENNLSPSPKRPSVENLSSRKRASEDEVKAGSYHMNQSSGHGVQFSDYLDKPRKNVLPNQSTDELNFKPFHSVQQSLEEGKLTSERSCSVWTGGADIGMNTNDAVEGCSSHVPFNVTEHVLSSPSTELNNLHVDNTSPKMCAQTLISTTHNLSELLLFNCSNELCELKKQDIETLKVIVNNLEECIPKNFGHASPPQESLFPQKTNQFRAESSGPRESVTVSLPQETRAAIATDLNQPNCQHVPEKKKHYVVFGKKHDNCSDGSEMGDADRAKEDKLTQSLKKVLSENFVEEETQPQILLYKNLWHEAEAALCAVTCRTRFNRMKTEMERLKLQTAQDLPENTAELEEVSQCTFFPNLNIGRISVPEGKDDSTRDIPVPDSPIISTNNHPEEVLARSHILKRRAANANMSATDVEEQSISKLSPDLNKVDKMSSEATDAPAISTRGSIVSSSSSPADNAEASVMARFHIPKSWIDHSSNLNVEGQLLPQVDLGFAGDREHLPTVKDTSENEILDISMEHVLHHDGANQSKDKLTVQEFHLHVKDDPIIQSLGMNSPGNQVPVGCYDNTSSDWEHILKEELPGQNR